MALACSTARRCGCNNRKYTIFCFLIILIIHSITVNLFGGVLLLSTGFWEVFLNFYCNSIPCSVVRLYCVPLTLCDTNYPKMYLNEVEKSKVMTFSKKSDFFPALHAIIAIFSFLRHHLCSQAIIATFSFLRRHLCSQAIIATFFVFATPFVLASDHCDFFVIFATLSIFVTFNI